MKCRKQKITIYLLIFLLVAIGAPADPPMHPAWWSDTGNNTAILAPSSSPDNSAFANVGQLKYVAYQAREYLNRELNGTIDGNPDVGGAGPAVDAVVNAFAQNTPDNYAPATVGQLKYIAQPFYDRLLAVGYDTHSILNFRITGNLSGNTWTSNYPWPAPPARPGQVGYDESTYNAWLQQNYAPVTLGQLKLAFSFDLDSSFSLSAIANAYASGLPNVWLTASGLYPFYGSVGEAGDASTMYAFLDEYGANLGHDPAYGADDSTVNLIVFKRLE